jgi:hypothetical protein
MTTATHPGDYDSEAVWRYKHARDELARAWEGLRAGERVSVLMQDAGPLLFLTFGYFVWVVAAHFFIGITWAAAPGTVFGFTPYEWNVAVYLIYNSVVLGILIVLVWMISAGSKSQWVWRTASFLLGFLVKSIGVFPSPT